MLRATLTCSETSSGSSLRRTPANATSRYNAPLSSRFQPTRSATRRLMVPLPEPEGPSIVTMGTAIADIRCRLASFPGAEESIVLFQRSQRDAQVFRQLVVAHRPH